VNARERDAVVRMLQDDLAGEHAAIIQYLQHVWRMGDTGNDIPCEVEEIARDEMRHFRWLAELVVDLGSDPTIERDVIYVNGSPPADLMLLDVDAEDRAIAMYLAHLRQIDDRRVQRVLERILVDERAHREMFRGFVAEFGGDPDAPTPRPDIGPFSGRRAAMGDIQQPASAETQREAAARPEEFGAYSARPTNEVIYVKEPARVALPPGHEQLIAALNNDIAKEYTTVLQYLFQSFVHKANRLGKELQLDIAQWHMKHWGWLAERISDLGGEVTTRHDDIDRTRDAAYVLRAGIARQRELAAHYGEQKDAIEDEEARVVLARIHAHDLYMASQLEDLLAEAERAGNPAAVFPAAGEPPPPAAPPARPTPRFTIGSLFGRPQDE
jgi:bacterioferritin